MLDQLKERLRALAQQFKQIRAEIQKKAVENTPSEEQKPQDDADNSKILADSDKVDKLDIPNLDGESLVHETGHTLGFVHESAPMEEQLKLITFEVSSTDFPLAVKKFKREIKPNLDGLSASIGPKGKNKPEDVLAVQYYLNKNGYACPMDAQFDSKLQRQISWFSRSAGIKTLAGVSPKDTDMWDFLTQKKPRPDINAVSEAYYSPDKVVSPPDPNYQLTAPVGKVNKNKTDILMVQQMLNQWGGYNLPENGIWAKIHGIALFDFQRQMGLEPTGIADSEVWEYLTGKKKGEKKIFDSTGGKNYGPKPKWISIAEGEIGVKEIPDAPAEGKAGKVNNPRVMEYHAASGGYNSDEPAWCASFASWCLTKAGIANPQDPGVIQWNGWGTKTDKAFYGAIAIVNTTGAWGHIGFVVGGNAKKGYQVLGGNQSNMVKISTYKNITTFIQPPGYTPSPEAFTLDVLEGDFGKNDTTR
jgi:uncharacterized protein (TIGR02594 family)